MSQHFEIQLSAVEVVSTSADYTAIDCIADLYKHLESTKYAGVLSQLLELFGRLSYHIGLNTVQLNCTVQSGRVCDESTFSYMTHNLLQSYEKYVSILLVAMA